MGVSSISLGGDFKGLGSGNFDPTSNTNIFELFDDHIISASQGGQMGWVRHQTGGTPEQIESTAARPGLWQFTITNTGDEAGMYVNDFGDQFLFGGGEITYGFHMKLGQIGDGTDDFVIVCGLGDDVIDPDQSNGAYFRYTSATDTNWQCVTEDNNTETASDSGVAASTSDANFKIVVNAAGNSVAFYINGTLVATNTTNIPTTAGRGVSALYHVKKTASGGTPAAHTFLADWTHIKYKVTTSRGSY